MDGATPASLASARSRLDALRCHLLESAVSPTEQARHLVESPTADNPTAGDASESWEKEVDELFQRRKLAAVLAEDEVGVQRQRSQGKLLVRERIHAVIDPGSFQEIGSAAGFAEYDKDGRMIGYQRSNLVQGIAKVDGQIVFVAADDFSVRGGSADRSILSKYEYGENLAREYRIPVIRICDGAAGSVMTLLSKGSTYIPKNPVSKRIKAASNVNLRRGLTTTPLIPFRTWETR